MVSRTMARGNPENTTNRRRRKTPRAVCPQVSLAGISRRVGRGACIGAGAGDGAVESAVALAGAGALGRTGLGRFFLRAMQVTQGLRGEENTSPGHRYGDTRSRQGRSQARRQGG